jgi:pimeloyl-ACP methyl ester carboxylesterase
MVSSHDGIPIAFQADGVGPDLVLVHGTGDSRLRWSSVSSALTRHFRLVAMDRRGRGESGDSPLYDLKREIEDVKAVISAADEPVNLLGHYFGGICAMEAALRSGRVNKLVLYEPPIPVAGDPLGEEYLDVIDGLLARGDLEAIWVSFLTEIIRMPERDITLFKASPSWNTRVQLARLLPREARVRSSYRFDAERFRAFRVPTLLLTGSESPPDLRAGVELLHAGLPESRIVVLQRQNHVAMSSAPALFLSEVLKFHKPK